ncbi:complement C1q-like protein 4 [Mytilus trossulus]|uniref:complement C1q-like protein 4 n=1 Tax=Mytilus trossulus TaxID=6551 RepID=UPI00300573AA
MLVKVVMCLMFVFVDQSLTTDAKGTCADDSKMDSLIKMVKEMQQHCSCTGNCCGCHKKESIAFYAALTKHTTLTGSQTIIYDKIYTNLGQSYDSSNGKFRAPVNGLYYFACTQISASGNVHFILMKNSSKLGHGYSDARLSTGSAIGTVLLEKGDVVTVQHHPGAISQQVHGGDYSTFTGYLITSL